MANGILISISSQRRQALRLKLLHGERLVDYHRNRAFAGLEADNEYVLSKLGDLDFSGPIYGLELKISKAEGKRLQINDGFGSLILTDFTPTSVHATNESNRAILTDSLPLNRYDRILWEAYTDYGVSNAGTLMQFNGPYAPRYAK